MARFNFRQGIARRQQDGAGNGSNLQPSNGGSYVDLIVSPDPTVFITAHYDVNYMFSENASVTKAWGPFVSGTDYWLYWDVDFITGELTRGYSLFEPVHGSTPPASPLADQHWFDSNETVMKVWTGTTWIEKIRTFTCKYQNGAIIVDYPIGSQVGIAGVRAFAGTVLFDPDGTPLQKFQRNRRGRFVTTETELHGQFSRISNFRVEAAIVQGKANENIPIHFCVSYSDFDELRLARNTVPEQECIGLAAEDMVTGEVRSYITKGFITNEVDWNWSAEDVGTPLFVGPTGELVTVPPISTSMQQVAMVINQTTIFVNIKPVIFLNNTGNITPLNVDRTTGRLHAHAGNNNGACKPPNNNATCVYGYNHDEIFPSTVWFIAHNFESDQVLAKVYDTTGDEIIPDEIQVVDINTLQITFNSPMAGKADLAILV